MNKLELERQIQALRAALAQPTALDADTAAQLLALSADIARVTEAHGDVSVTDRLEELAVRFESDHPAAGNAIRQAIDALVKAGI